MGCRGEGENSCLARGGPIHGGDGARGPCEWRNGSAALISRRGRKSAGRSYSGLLAHMASGKVISAGNWNGVRARQNAKGGSWSEDTERSCDARCFSGHECNATGRNDACRPPTEALGGRRCDEGSDFVLSDTDRIVP